MSEYPFHLRQEVLLEKGAAVLAKLSRCEPRPREFENVWRAKRELLLTSTEAELLRIEERFDNGAQSARQMSIALSTTEVSVDSLVGRELSLTLEHSSAHDHPRAFLLAGQPGAGKTELSALLNLLLDGDGVLINGDEYRRCHSQSQRLNDVSVELDFFSEHGFHSYRMLGFGFANAPEVCYNTNAATLYL